MGGVGAIAANPALGLGIGQAGHQSLDAVCLSKSWRVKPMIGATSMLIPSVRFDGRTKLLAMMKASFGGVGCDAG